MKIFKSKHKLQKAITHIKNISFIPTMGGLHQGHISLIKKSKKFKGKKLVSIFVNPKQFNERKDFLNYPRNLNKDLKILKQLKIDFVYLPNLKEIFSFRPSKKIFLDKFSRKLCGAYRKSHFLGVLNIVNRFLEIIKPKFLFLGMKDFQQLQIIRSLSEKLNLGIEIIACPLIRSNNGLALSSRNSLLSNKQREAATIIYETFNLINTKASVWSIKKMKLFLKIFKS